MSKKKPYHLQQITIADVAAEGKAVARHEGKVFFVRNAVPGDVVDLYVFRDRRSYAEADVTAIHEHSTQRVQPQCEHFGTCGGCKWQNMDYQWQLHYKLQQVNDQFTRMGKFPFTELLPIAGADAIYTYRNKLEYTFSSSRWLTQEEITDKDASFERNGAGFHIPGKFDKILDIDKCWLQDDLSNAIRNAVKYDAIQHGISFYDIRNQHGALRNMIVRNTTAGEWMILFSFGTPMDDQLTGLMNRMQALFPQVASWLYVINMKKNDTIQDLPVIVHSGNDHITEQLGTLKFRISPKSFFQTNPVQAKKLYDITRDFAGLTGSEVVYDLYTGTGSIACYVADGASKVIGVEYVEDAIADAKINAALNGITNTEFFAGDMKDMLDDAFIAAHGRPDVVITDPPRAGMHEDVVKKLLELEPHKIVYVSCNPATQARDLSLLSEKYTVEKVQPVDMFPHTHHVENIALLLRKPV